MKTSHQARNKERILARRVICNGTSFRLAVAEAYNDNGAWRVAITPFSEEIHSTSYHNGILEVTDNDGNPFVGPSPTPPIFTLS